jgi:hypothetical protein
MNERCYSYNNTNNTCSVPYCLNCSYNNTNVCTYCQSNYTLVNGICIMKNNYTGKCNVTNCG